MLRSSSEKDGRCLGFYYKVQKPKLIKKKGYKNARIRTRRFLEDLSPPPVNFWPLVFCEDHSPSLGLTARSPTLLSDSEVMWRDEQGAGVTGEVVLWPCSGVSWPDRRSHFTSALRAAASVQGAEKGRVSKLGARRRRVRLYSSIHHLLPPTGYVFKCTHTRAHARP